MDFDEEKILDIAQRAKDCGVELFVLDDGDGLGQDVRNMQVLETGLRIRIVFRRELRDLPGALKIWA